MKSYGAKRFHLIFKRVIKDREGLAELFNGFMCGLGCGTAFFTALFVARAMVHL